MHTVGRGSTDGPRPDRPTFRAIDSIRQRTLLAVYGRQDLRLPERRVAKRPTRMKTLTGYHHDANTDQDGKLRAGTAREVRQANVGLPHIVELGIGLHAILGIRQTC